MKTLTYEQIADPCKVVHQRSVEDLDLQLDKGHVLPTNYWVLRVRRKVVKDQEQTHDIDLSMMVFLHCPSDPVSAISCVNLPIS